MNDCFEQMIKKNNSISECEMRLAIAVKNYTLPEIKSALAKYGLTDDFIQTSQTILENIDASNHSIINYNRRAPGSPGKIKQRIKRLKETYSIHATLSLSAPNVMRN